MIGELTSRLSSFKTVIKEVIFKDEISDGTLIPLRLLYDATLLYV